MNHLSASKLTLFASLQKKKYRQQHGLTWIDGRKLVEELLRSSWTVEALVLTEAALRELEAPPDLPLFEATDKQFARLSDLKTPEGWGAAVRLPSLSARPPAPSERGLLLQGVSDPGNLGALTRIADWFGLDGVWVDAATADPYSPKALRASMGSCFRIPVRVVADFSGMVEEAGSRVVAAVLDGRPLQAGATLPGKDLLLLGSESHGLRLPSDLLARLDFVSIPRGGGAESLNVAMAGAILSWALWGHSLPSPKSEG